MFVETCGYSFTILFVSAKFWMAALTLFVLTDVFIAYSFGVCKFTFVFKLTESGIVVLASGLGFFGQPFL